MTKKISICVITYLRPKSLTRLLDSLFAQINISTQAYDVEIVIVDNDLTGENKNLIETLKPQSPFDLVLVEEEKRGIPHARNKAVEAAWDADALIFVDDDEVVPTGWLATMLKTWEDTDADIVTGPVKAQLPDNSPSWAMKSDTYSEVRRHETGEIVTKAYTNNTLISRHVYHSITPAFDPVFRYTGSEDIHFFQRAVLQGFQIIWCAEAEIQEIIPSSRVKFWWLVKRSFRNGSGDAISRIKINKNAQNYLKVFAIGSGRCVHGVGFFVKGIVVLDWKPFIRGVRLFLSGLGTYAGMVGINYNEYKTVHGE